jgi:type III secretion protein U
MSESSSEKTEEATPKKLRDARKQGQVAKSQDVVTATLVLSVFCVIKWSWEDFLQSMIDLINYITYYYDAPFSFAVYEIMTAVLIKMAKLLAPLLLTVIIMAIAANFFQIGFLFAPEAIMPKLEKLNPIEGFKKIFSKKNFVEFLKSFLKVAFLSFLIYLMIKRDMELLLLVPYGGMTAILEMIGPLVWDFAKTVIIIYIVIAAFDYFFQQKSFMDEMKMTKDEVKREYKEMEGDPEIKSKRKQLHEEMAMQDTAQNTRKSSVLVTNPTHYAIAVWYKPGVTRLPIVMAKGQGFFAEMMMRIAQEEDIPIMQNIPLAHALYADANVLMYIPSDLIEPVAEVIRWAYQLELVKQQEMGG